MTLIYIPVKMRRGYRRLRSSRTLNILNPQHPRPSTIDPRPSTLNPHFQTLDFKPSTLAQEEQEQEQESRARREGRGEGEEQREEPASEAR